MHSRHLLRRGGYGERVPLVRGYLRDPDKDVVPGGELELGRALDDQLGHPGGQRNPLQDGGLPSAPVDGEHGRALLQEEDDAGKEDALPEDGSVQHQQHHVRIVQKVAHVENLQELGVKPLCTAGACM